MSVAAAPAIAAGSSWFQRFLLPGFAFKAVVIGGGYATGRELAEFFLPSGPWGGLAAMLLAMVLWSIICATTFAFARTIGALYYRSSFEGLLGRGWILFEIRYVRLVTLISSGYRFLSWVFLAVYVVPLLTVGLVRLVRGRVAHREQEFQPAFQGTVK